MRVAIFCAFMSFSCISFGLYCLLYPVFTKEVVESDPVVDEVEDIGQEPKKEVSVRKLHDSVVLEDYDVVCFFGKMYIQERNGQVSYTAQISPSNYNLCGEIDNAYQ